MHQINSGYAIMYNDIFLSCLLFRLELPLRMGKEHTSVVFGKFVTNRLDELIINIIIIILLYYTYVTTQASTEKKIPGFLSIDSRVTTIKSITIWFLIKLKRISHFGRLVRFLII